MKGRWAAGIVPRNFAWIINGYLAVAERPGGSAPTHRRVRRHEEILWLRGQGFTKVVSLLPSNHNLHAYEELGLPYEHIPMGYVDDPSPALAELYPALLRWLHGGERVLLHQDELGERMAGVLAGFLLWSALVPEPPLAISAVEQLLRRQLGATGRTIVMLAVELPPPSEEDRRRPERVAMLVPLRFPPEQSSAAEAEDQMPLDEHPGVISSDGEENQSQSQVQEEKPKRQSRGEATAAKKTTATAKASQTSGPKGSAVSKEAVAKKSAQKKSAGD